MTWVKYTSECRINWNIQFTFQEIKKRFFFKKRISCWRLIIIATCLPAAAAAAAAKSLQSLPILCDPIDGSPPGSPVPGILQARTLEGVAISFSNA